MDDESVVNFNSPAKEKGMCPTCGTEGNVMDEDDNGGAIDELNVCLECSDCEAVWTEYWETDWEMKSWSPGEDWPDEKRG